MILDIISEGIKLVGEIVKIIGEDGDEAGNKRLKDIKGWDRLFEKCRKKEGRRAFMEAWKGRDNKPEE
jgi:hypothetical protein